MSISRERIAEIKSREDVRFAGAHAKSRAALDRARQSMPHGVPMSWMTDLYNHPPMFVAEADGIQFTDIDGNHYRDFSLGITAAFCGHNPAPVVAAAARQLAKGRYCNCRRRIRFGSPRNSNEDIGNPNGSSRLRRARPTPSCFFSRGLRRTEGRCCCSKESITGTSRLCSRWTTRGGTVPEYRGILSDEVKHTVVVPFNDLSAVEQALRQGDIALILTEPAMTNLGLIMPIAGFHDGLRSLPSSTM